MAITVSSLPQESRCKNYIMPVDYQDAYRAPLLHPKQEIDEIYLHIFNHAPKWVDFLFNIRNSIVGWMGLNTFRDRKKQRVTKLEKGAKVGIFHIYDIYDKEVIAGEDDRHLDFRVSVFKDVDHVVVSTLVKYNNFFGKAYMTIILPFHWMIVKAMLSQAIKNKRI